MKDSVVQGFVAYKTSYVNTRDEIVKMLNRANSDSKSLEAQLCALPDVQRLFAKHICPDIQLPKTNTQKSYDAILQSLKECVEWNEEYKEINHLVGDPWCFDIAKRVLAQEKQ